MTHDSIWKKYECGKRKYDLRFGYYSFSDGKGGTYYHRETKKWYRPIEQLGHILKGVVYKLHDRFGKMIELTEKDREKKSMPVKMYQRKNFLIDSLGEIHTRKNRTVPCFGGFVKT